MGNAIRVYSYYMLSYSGAYRMQSQRISRQCEPPIIKPREGSGRTLGLKYTGLSFLMCCILLFLSSCSGLLGSAAPADPTAVISKPSPSPSRTIVKRDGEAESRLNAQQAKVQQLMAGMTPDQKLRQILIVEYTGNNYTRTDLQHMIAQQYVGGFLYQEINQNFTPPYDLLTNVAAFSR